MVDTAVFVAAGLGSRLKEKTKEIPKGFLEVGGEALIKRSVALLKKHGIRRFIFGTGYHSEYYEEFTAGEEGMICIKSPVYRDTSSFYTLINCRDAIDRDFLLLESDLIYEEDALRILIDDPRKDVILASGFTGSGDEVYIETGENGKLINMSKDRQSLNKIDGELVGISKVSLEQFQSLCHLAGEDEKLLMKGDYETAFVRLSATQPFLVEKKDGLVWAEIDDADHLERVENDILPKLEVGIYGN